MIFAVMGMNGTGKTTLCSALEKSLQGLTSWRVVYRGGFDYVLLEYPLRFLVKRRMKVSLTGPGSDPAARAPGLGLRMWPYAVFVDCLAGWAWARVTGRGRVLLFDRYFFDYLPTFDRLGCNSRLVRRLFLSLPRPDLAFVLDTPAELAFERKKDQRGLTLTEYVDQRESYLRLGKLLHIPVVNTARPLDQTLAEVLKAIVDSRKLAPARK